MKVSTKLAYLFFLIAIGLELLASQQMYSNLKLFVGVFIVLGTAFMIYSIRSISNLKGSLLFEDASITQDTLIKPHQQEFLLKEDTSYLLIGNSLFLDWKDASFIKRFLYGVVASLSGKRTSTGNYLIIKPKKDIYVKEAHVENLSEVTSVDIIKTGQAKEYDSKVTFAGMIISFQVAFLLVLYLIIYILLQLF